MTRPTRLRALQVRLCEDHMQGTNYGPGTNYDHTSRVWCTVPGVYPNPILPYSHPLLFAFLHTSPSRSSPPTEGTPALGALHPYGASAEAKETAFGAPDSTASADDAVLPVRAETQGQEDSLVGDDDKPPAHAHHHHHSSPRSPSLPTRVSWFHPTSVLSVLVVLLSMGAFGLHFALQATSWLDVLASEKCDPKFTWGTCTTRRAWMGVTPEVEAVVWVLCVGGIICCSAILAQITCLWRRGLLQELKQTGLVRSASRKISTTRAGKNVAEAVRAFEGGLGFASRAARRGHRCCFRCGQCVSTGAAFLGWAEYFSGAHR